MEIKEYKELPQCCKECKDWLEYGNKLGADAVCYNCDYWFCRFYIITKDGKKIEHSAD